MEPTAEPQVLKSPEQKYCTDCGKLILRRAEICPACGCRQLPSPTGKSSLDAVTTTFTQAASNPIFGPMILLLVVNVLWNGLGNISVGDNRGWKYGLANLFIFAASLFTMGIPCMLFFAYCGYEGHRYLSNKTARRQMELQTRV